MIASARQTDRDDFPRQVNAYLGIANDTVAGISNLSTQVAAVGSGDHRVPVSVNSSEPGNAWVCSPYTSYARYSIEELQRFDHPLLTQPISVVCRALGAYLRRTGIDDAVGINNWLLSTILYPQIDTAVVRAWVSEAVQRWPRHAIWFRSLNGRYNADWLEALANADFKLIPSRQVYLYDRIDATTRRPQNLRRDLALLRMTMLAASSAASWTASDFARAAELYGLLYLEKYSRLNPAYGARFLSAWHSAGLLDLTGYRDERGVLQAVIGMFALGSTITAPIVGYDTAQPQRAGLYRLLMATVYDRAARSGARINLSAGAASFKRLRGGVASVEYSAVYSRHLPRKRRRAISLLAGIAEKLGAPILRRFEL